MAFLQFAARAKLLFNPAIVGRSQKYRSLIISFHDSVLTPPGIRAEERGCAALVHVCEETVAAQARRTR